MNSLLLVGGTFSDEGGKPSGVIGKLGRALTKRGFKVGVVNGGRSQDLPTCPLVERHSSLDTTRYDTIIWMPNVPNEWEKRYPEKKIGAILICSKAMREGVTRYDAVNRIFKMHGNAVLEVSQIGNQFRFSLVDALGNEWVSTTDLEKLCVEMNQFVLWIETSIRVNSRKVGEELVERSKVGYLSEFLFLVRGLADFAEESVTSRYFGNASTRCMKFFPSSRIDEEHQFSSSAWVSARNIDKRRIKPVDMVFVGQGVHSGQVEYFGDRKPSVDTPVQLVLYEMYPQLNFLIHGHLYVSGAYITADYYPCGDMRELTAIHQNALEGSGVINLRNHGFLMYAESLRELKDVANYSRFELLPAWRI